jgi:hypothetical protein
MDLSLKNVGESTPNERAESYHLHSYDGVAYLGPPRNDRAKQACLVGRNVGEVGWAVPLG